MRGKEKGGERETRACGRRGARSKRSKTRAEVGKGKPLVEAGEPETAECSSRGTGQAEEKQQPAAGKKERRGYNVKKAGAPCTFTERKSNLEQRSGRETRKEEEEEEEKKGGGEEERVLRPGSQQPPLNELQIKGLYILIDINCSFALAFLFLCRKRSFLSFFILPLPSKICTISRQRILREEISSYSFRIS